MSARVWIKKNIETCGKVTIYTSARMKAKVLVIETKSANFWIWRVNSCNGRTVVGSS